MDSQFWFVASLPHSFLAIRSQPQARALPEPKDGTQRERICGSGIFFVNAAIELSYTNIMVSSPKVVLLSKATDAFVNRIEPRAFADALPPRGSKWPVERKEEGRRHAKSAERSQFGNYH